MYIYILSAHVHYENIFYALHVMQKQDAQHCKCRVIIECM